MLLSYNPMLLYIKLYCTQMGDITTDLFHSRSDLHSIQNCIDMCNHLNSHSKNHDQSKGSSKFGTVPLQQTRNACRYNVVHVQGVHIINKLFKKRIKCTSVKHPVIRARPTFFSVSIWPKKIAGCSDPIRI